MPSKSNVVRFLVGLQNVLLILSGELIASPPLLLQAVQDRSQLKSLMNLLCGPWGILDASCGPQAFVYVFLQELNLLFLLYFLFWNEKKTVLFWNEKNQWAWVEGYIHLIFFYFSFHHKQIIKKSHFFSLPFLYPFFHTLIFLTLTKYSINSNLLSIQWF